ncbi:MAG TPA: MAB_1171c family putative transporter [Pseudonocardiaceae bacterium]|nr:MAB_1171c family putative transporter [Pseudonocardiaceae bacterium]
MNALDDSLAAILPCATIWKLYQLTKAPHDKPLRAVTACLASAAIAYPFGVADIAAPVDAVIGTGVSKLVQNALLFCAGYFLMCFYLYSAADGEFGRRRARREIIPLVTSIVAITIATFVTPIAQRGAAYDTGDMRHVPGIALFYFFGGLYMAYALALAFRWTVRYARRSHRPLVTGLRIAATGMAAMVIGSGVRTVFVVIRVATPLTTSPVIVGADLLVAAGIPTFVIGVIYPALATRIAALRVWWQHRRLCHQLGPLWTMLHEAYPEDALSRVPAGRWRDLLRLRGVHRRYYRRVIECRDGLVRVSPYLAGLGEPEPPGELDAPGRLADALREALRARAAGEPVAGPAMPVAVPEGDGLDADVKQLVALSRALR